MRVRASILVAIGVSAVAFVVLAVPWWSTSSSPVHGRTVDDSRGIIGGGSGIDPITNHAIGFMPMFYGVVLSDEAAIEQALPSPGVVTQLHVRLEGPLQSGQQYSFVVRQNGADTGIGCTIQEFQQACADFVNAASFSAGDLIALKSVREGVASGGCSCDAGWTAEFSREKFVGGIAETPLAISGGAGSSNVLVGSLVVAAGFATFVGAGWYVWRRWAN